MGMLLTLAVCGLGLLFVVGLVMIYFVLRDRESESK